MALTVDLIHLNTPAASSGYHVAGTTPAGPYNEAVRVGSMGEYRRLFGTRTPATAALYDDLELFFAEGGAEAYVTRVPAGSTPLNYVAALDATAGNLRGLAVAIPELPAGTIGRDLIAHAAATGRIALLAPEATATVTDVQALAGELALEADADHAGLFYPWVMTTSRLGQRKALPPTGFVAAARARAHRVGYWVHPAGERSKARWVTGLLTPVDRADAWELADHLVSGICTAPDGVQLWGWWSLAADRLNFAHLSTRDLLNNIADDLSLHFTVAAEAKWSTPEQTYVAIRSAAITVLARLAAAGGLTRGMDGEDDGYRISMVLSPDRTTVNVAVDVRPLQYARLVGFILYRIPVSVPIPRSTP